MASRIFARLMLLAVPLAAASAVEMVSPPSPHVSVPAEFRLRDVPVAANPFDPDSIRVDGRFVAPDGRAWSVPAFWFRDYRRRLAGGREVLDAIEPPEWRLRFLPSVAGVHSLSVTVITNGQAAGGSVQATFDVANAEGPRPGTGPVRIAENNRYFETADGRALPLIGHCVCWHGIRGTYDYDDWFGAMAAAGENYTRLWMAPWAFGIEADKDTLLHYRLDRAWQLDQVLRLAETRGIEVMLCFDYHGMFESKPDYWGANDNWKINPYNAANGGPCATQNEFFTLPTARALYQKRLRYLVARYGYSPNLLAWQFFNEIDNVYAYLRPADVAAWHAEAGAWLKANDPWRHLITTSLTGGSDRPEIWKLPQLDFAMYHSYSQAQPAVALPQIVKRFLTAYGKPVMIGEFGTDWRGWRRDQDPYLRGWRQGIWAGALSGSVGTSMSWWWEMIYAEGLDPTLAVLRDFAVPAGWGAGQWEPLSILDNGPPPVRVGDANLGGAPFAVTLPLDANWGSKPAGQLAVPSEDAVSLSAGALSGFVHGTAHPDLKTPFKLDAWFADAARIVVRLNSVSNGALLGVFVDGTEVFHRSLPNKDGQWVVNGEYNEDIPIDLSPGRHLVVVRNLGVDWFFLDWVRLESVRPAQYAGGWQPSPVATGLRRDREGLVYVVNPRASYPANATNAVVPPLHQASLRLRGWPAGKYRAQWMEPKSGNPAGETIGASDGTTLVFPLPDVPEDLAARLTPYREFSLREPAFNAIGAFTMRLDAEEGHGYRIEASPDLRGWTALASVTNQPGGCIVEDALAGEFPRRFYRARLDR